jgi:hypothetical protein
MRNMVEKICKVRAMYQQIQNDTKEMMEKDKLKVSGMKGEV